MGGPVIRNEYISPARGMYSLLTCSSTSRASIFELHILSMSTQFISSGRIESQPGTRSVTFFLGSL